MTPEEYELGRMLARVFENVVMTEEKSLQKGYFADLSISEMHTLDAIGPYEAKTMTETAAALDVTTGTLTVSIDRLVRKGYVIRKRDENDRRIVRISLTRDGKVACRMHSKFHAVLARKVLESYSAEEKAMLIHMVDDIDKFLSSQLAKYDDRDDSELSIRQTARQVARESRRKENE